jgi:hypothetical protein
MKTLKRMYDLTPEALEKLKQQAIKNRRSLSNELCMILENLPEVKKEGETVQKSVKHFFSPGKIYFNDQKEECTYISAYDNDMGIFKNHEYNNECTYEYNTMYLDSNCVKKVIQ